MNLQKEVKALQSKYLRQPDIGQIVLMALSKDKCGQTKTNENFDRAEVLKDPSINSKVYYQNKNTFSKNENIRNYNWF